MKIFACSQTRDLGEKIAKHLNIELGKYNVHKFSDGEFQPAYEESVRGCSVFIIQSTCQPSENLMELLLLIDAARRASAYKIIAVIPYFGWARQDRKPIARSAIGAKLIANMLMAAGTDRVMTMDLHADPIQGFFDVPVDHLYASSIFIPYIQSLNLKNIAVAAPDTGGSKRANAYSRFLNAEMIIAYKLRKKANHIEEYKVIGDIKDKDVVIIDDMIDTAGTVTTAAHMMREEGANSIRVIATHAVLSGPAFERIENSCIDEVIVTDTIPLKKPCKKIKVLSVSELFAKVIHNVFNYQPISEHFLV